MIRAGRIFFVFANVVFGAYFSTPVGATERVEESSGERVEESSGPIASPIINGTTVTNGSLPWMAAIVRNTTSARPQRDSFTCGATLIDPLWILTAAHCIDDREPEDLKIIIGRENLDDSGGEIRLVTEIIAYPSDKDSFGGVDIALLRLDRASTHAPLQITNSTQERSLEGQLVTVYGWGSTSGVIRPECDLVFQDTKQNTEKFFCDTYTYAPSDLPAKLLSADLTLVSTVECNAKYRQILTNAGYPPVNLAPDAPPIPNELCAWDRTNLAGPCYGDSGGPLVGTIDGKQILLGIVIHGLMGGCQTSSQIDFFTQVSKFSNFIAETKGRSLGLAFQALCPTEVVPSVAYEKQPDGNTRVTVSWIETSTIASGYRLYYTPLPRQGSFGKIDLPASDDEFSIVLTPGLKFIIALQVISSKCDSPISEPVTVLVP